MLEGNIVLYRRTRTRKWQARFKIGNYWKRITTKYVYLSKLVGDWGFMLEYGLRSGV